MKSEKILWVFIVVIFALVGLVYLQLMQQDQATTKVVQTLAGKVNGFDLLVKKIESEVKSNTDIVKNADGRIAAGDSERKDLAAKIDNIIKDVQQMQNDLKNSLMAKEVNVTPAPVAPEAAPTQPEVATPAPETAAPAQAAEAPKL